MSYRHGGFEGAVGHAFDSCSDATIDSASSGYDMMRYDMIERNMSDENVTNEKRHEKIR